MSMKSIRFLAMQLLLRRTLSLLAMYIMWFHVFVWYFKAQWFKKGLPHNSLFSINRGHLASEAHGLQCKMMSYSRPWHMLTVRHIRETYSWPFSIKCILFELTVFCPVNIKWLRASKKFEKARNKLLRVDNWLYYTWRNDSIC